MLSPWVTFDQTALGYKANSGKDVLDARALKSWSDAFMGGAKVDPYNHPLSADPQWWDGVPAERLCMTAGKDELFHDDICAFAEKVKVRLVFFPSQLEAGAATVSSIARSIQC